MLSFRALVFVVSVIPATNMNGSGCERNCGEVISLWNGVGQMCVLRVGKSSWCPLG